MEINFVKVLNFDKVIEMESGKKVCKNARTIRSKIKNLQGF